MRLASLAAKNVITAAPWDSLDKAISLMEEHQIHHLPIVIDGKPAGIVSDRDLLLSVGWKLTSGRRTHDHPSQVIGPAVLSEVMSKPVVTIPHDASVLEAARVMVGRCISALVLTRNNQIAGIVSKIDLLRFAQDLPLGDVRQSALFDSVTRHMRASLVTAKPRDSVAEVARLMHDHHIRHVPVAVDDCLLGIVSDRDIRRAFGKEWVEDAQAEADGKLLVCSPSVMEIMIKDVKTAEPDATMITIAQDMADFHIGALPVVTNDMLIGIVTDTDVVRILGRLGE